jgi:hypothetical protein
MVSPEELTSSDHSILQLSPQITQDISRVT